MSGDTVKRGARTTAGGSSTTVDDSTSVNSAVQPSVSVTAPVAVAGSKPWREAVSVYAPGLTPLKAKRPSASVASSPTSTPSWDVSRTRTSGRGSCRAFLTTPETTPASGVGYAGLG